MLSDNADSIMLINSWLDQVGKECGLKLVLDGLNGCHIKLEGKFDTLIRVSPSGEVIQIVALIGDHRYDRDTNVLEALLAYNVKSDLVSGCLVGLCRKLSRYTLSINILIAGLNGMLFRSLLLDLGTTLLKMDGIISGFAHQGRRACDPISLFSSTTDLK